MKKLVALFTGILLALGAGVSAQAYMFGTESKKGMDSNKCPLCGKSSVDYAKYIDKQSIVAKVLSEYEKLNYSEEYEEGYEADYYEDEYFEESEETQNNTAIVCIEAFTVGGGYIIAPVEIEVYEDVNCAYILDELLTANEMPYSNTGSLDGGFYLASIENILEFTPVISEKLTAALEAAGFQPDAENYTPTQLAEFDFTFGSGWMYSVNGEFPDVGFSEYCLEPGDVMRIQFTLAYGSDIGDSSRMGINIADGIFEFPNRDELTKIIAKTGIENCGEYIDAVTCHDLTYKELEEIVEALKMQ